MPTVIELFAFIGLTSVVTVIVILGYEAIKEYLTYEW